MYKGYDSLTSRYIYITPFIKLPVENLHLLARKERKSSQFGNLNCGYYLSKIRKLKTYYVYVFLYIAQLAGAVEYTDSFSAKE